MNEDETAILFRLSPSDAAWLLRYLVLSSCSMSLAEYNERTRIVAKLKKQIDGEET